MGMTYEGFWEQDPSLATYYYKAYQQKQRIENERLWLQGMYIYDALCDASPLFHDLAKPGTRAKPYPEKPYEMNNSVKSEVEVEQQNKRKMMNGRDAMMAWMTSHNASFVNKQEGGVGDGRS